MAFKAKIIGAGSIGNHLAQACRRAGWDVIIVDRDPAALARTKNDIYPSRYGAWDPAIRLFEAGKDPKGGFDVIFIGTPPHVRIPLALEALKERPKVMQLEKPLCTPDRKGLAAFRDTARRAKVAVIVGYDHAVAESIEYVDGILSAGGLGKIDTIDVEFREHWGGIFKAHPWLSGPQDTYLGFTKNGGGASGEHSHAMHLFLHLARMSGLGLPKTGHAMYEWREEGHARFDAVAAFTLGFKGGRIGRVIQDVVTNPTRKWARVQGSSGFVEWHCNGRPEGDLVLVGSEGKAPVERVFAKKRPDDFYREIMHLDSILRGRIDPKDSPLSIETGLFVMSILASAYKKGGMGSFRLAAK